MATTILVKCVGNNSPGCDGKLFYEQIKTIISENGKQVQGIATAELKPRDNVIIQRGKRPRTWYGTVADSAEAAHFEETASPAEVPVLSSSSTSSVSQEIHPKPRGKW